MNVDEPPSWRLRLAAWLVRPLGLSIGRADDQGRLFGQREKLAKALAHERDKVGKVKRRLEALQAVLDQARADRDDADRKRDAYRAEAWAAGKELALLRPSAPAPLSASAVLAAACARVQVRRRAAWIDSGPADAASIRDGVLSPTWPAVGPAAAGSAARTSSPLRIATVGDWRSPLADTAHLGVVARQLDDPLVEAADVVVFPRCEDMDFAQKAGLVPERLWRRAREGETTLVLDSSNEAFRFWRGHAQQMHDFLAARGVDPVHAVHLTQDRLYREDYEPWCAAAKLTPMGIVVFDAFIGRTLQAVRDNGQQLFEGRLAAFADRPERRSRRFLSLNFAARPTKVLFLMRLLRDGLFDRGWISFGGFQSEGEDAKLGKTRVLDRLGALHGFGEEAATLTRCADQLDAMGPVLFGVGRDDQGGVQRKQVLQADDLAEYGDSWFSVVTETEMHPRSHRITEKPFKPLLNFHPFLVLGNPGSLAALRGYGFETFSEIFDEAYDEELHPRRRFDMVYEQLVRLCATDEAEMARMTEQVCEVLSYNACWGLTELPRRFAETMVQGVIAQLAPAARRA
jgi:hypothetical protein